jgi:Domain of unknown function (DUF5753)
VPTDVIKAKCAPHRKLGKPDGHRRRHDELDGDFLLLDLDEAQSIGHIEYPTGAVYIQDQDQVGACTLSADRWCAAALSESDSVDAIVARIETLKTNSED